MLKKEFLRLLKEDEEFRHAVAGLIGYEELLEGQQEIRAEIKKLWEEVKGLRLEQQEIRAEIKKLWEEVKSLREDFRSMNRKLDALGARWGIMSESAFRETLRGVLEGEIEAEVEKWSYWDDEGYVFGYPAVVDIDIVVKNGAVLVIEVTSHARASDIATLKRKVELYEKVTGRKVKEIIVSSPFVDDSAREAAAKLGVRIYTS